MGESFDLDVNCERAIIEIAGVLVNEGLFLETEHYAVSGIIERQLESTDRTEEQERLIMMYHVLIWKTANLCQWTLPRSTGECRVIAYLPNLIRATQMQMVAEQVILNEKTELEPELFCEVTSHLDNPELWVEISLIDFINGCCPKGDRLEGARSQSIVQVISSKERSLSWRDGQDSDRLRGEYMFKSLQETGDGALQDNGEEQMYVKSDRDIRKLYELRPVQMKNMPLAQFASEFWHLKPAHHFFENIRENIDPVTGLGPPSTRQIAGCNALAPQCMQLTNQHIMSLRQERKAVLQLLNRDRPGRHGNQLLWSPWRFLENVSGRQHEEETEDQKKVRLQVFPKSVFPTLPEGDDEDD